MFIIHLLPLFMMSVAPRNESSSVIMKLGTGCRLIGESTGSRLRPVRNIPAMFIFSLVFIICCESFGGSWYKKTGFLYRAL